MAKCGVQTEEVFPVKFTVDAHLISVLGEQLIASEHVGILELIKNSYDAGANDCEVYIEKVPGLDALEIRKTRIDTEKLAGPVITIIDDGVGMDKERLENGWLRAATIFKTNTKERYRLEKEKALDQGKYSEFNAIQKQIEDTNEGRLPLGEKGIGRLATHRLGKFLWLRTKRANEPFEWELKIDWDLFDSNDTKNLGDIPLELRRQNPTFDYGVKNQGTIICSYGGRSGFTWAKGDLIKVGRSIANLKSPHKEPSRFNVLFKSSYDLGEELMRPTERVPAPYDVFAEISQIGIADITIKFNTPPALLDKLNDRIWTKPGIDLRDIITAEDKSYWKVQAGAGYRNPTCGPFQMNFRIWIRDAKWIKEDRHEISEYLDAYGGIGIYRDGLAVMTPDAVAHIDALNLSIRARKKTNRLTYYNLVGQIEISQDENPGIRDQSSREGQLKNREFEDLIRLAKAVILEVESYHLAIREELRKGSIEPVKTPILRKHSRIAATLLDTLIEKYEFKEDSLGLSDLLSENSNMGAKEYLGKVSITLKDVDNHLKLIRDQNKQLIEAAGYGLAIAVAMHELTKSLANISTLMEMFASGKRKFSEVEIGELSIQAKVIQSEIKRIDPLRVTRLERAKVFNVRLALSAAVGVLKSRADSMGVELILPSLNECFDVRARFTACSQVFANLIDNALFWLTTPSWQHNKKIIKVSCTTNNRRLIFEDTGPGIHETVLLQLFEPFVTKKPDGQGLGLYISDFYLRQMRARIWYEPNGGMEFKGARFVIDFLKVPEE